MNREFTLTELLTVAAIIAMLAGLGFPAILRARTRSQAHACIVNLKNIEAAKQQWATEHRVSPTHIPLASDLQPYLGRGTSGRLPICPADPASTFDTSYFINDLRSAPGCQIDLTNHIL